MLRVPVSKLQPGMILARPVVSPQDSKRYLVQRDREVPADMIPRLKELGIMDVWVRYQDLEFLEEMIDEGLGDHQRDVYQHVRRNFEQVMTGAAFELDISKYQSSIGDLFNFLKQSSAGSVLLSKLECYDNYLMSHVTNVCYLSLLLGMKLEKYLIDERSFKTAREAKDLQLLGLGCLLHDVGKMKVPVEILNKPSRLTEEEMKIMEMHALWGYDMVKGQVPASAAQIVLNHHQRFNGQGYPSRIDPVNGNVLPPLMGKQIPIFSRIATICDVYDAATPSVATRLPSHRCVCYMRCEPGVRASLTRLSSKPFTRSFRHFRLGKLSSSAMVMKRQSSISILDILPDPKFKAYVTPTAIDLLILHRKKSIWPCIPRLPSLIKTTLMCGHLSLRKKHIRIRSDKRLQSSC